MIFVAVSKYAPARVYFAYNSCYFKGLEKDPSSPIKYLPGALQKGCVELKGFPAVRGISCSISLQCPQAQEALNLMSSGHQW